jgi:hypothetical protein
MCSGRSAVCVMQAVVAVNEMCSVYGVAAECRCAINGLRYTIEVRCAECGCGCAAHAMNELMQCHNNGMRSMQYADDCSQCNWCFTFNRIVHTIQCGNSYSIHCDAVQCADVHYFISVAAVCSVLCCLQRWRVAGSLTNEWEPINIHCIKWRWEWSRTVEVNWMLQERSSAQQ